MRWRLGYFNTINEIMQAIIVTKYNAQGDEG